MKNKNLIKIIKQKGVGIYLGKSETNFGRIENYSAYVQISLKNGEKYSVSLFTNPILPIYSNKCLYNGKNRNEAEETYTKLIEKDIKIKQNLANKIFNLNQN